MKTLVPAVPDSKTPGLIHVGTRACPVCGATAKSLSAQVDIRRYVFPGRRRGKPISPATSRKLAKPFLHFGAGCRFLRPAKGPSFPVQQMPWAEGDFYDTVTVDVETAPMRQPAKRYNFADAARFTPRGRR